MQTLANNFGFVTLLAPVDANGSSLSKSNATFFSMKGYSKATIIINCGAMTEATTIVKAYQAKNVARASLSSTALSLTHYWSNKSSTSVMTMARFTASSNQLTITSVNSTKHIFEIDAKQLNATSQFDCVGIAITGISAAALMQMEAILHPARYAAMPLPINALAN